ncbi:hypothetical protein ACFQ22_10370 [Lentilactobacillus raoultii]|uniref:DUF4263 domain-containing protein n=1 Tax=Lentilactobacillus raoultii TaxID=1987503 RepID=A0ABW3PPA6_9LACO|nr:hypothetical protein [Lentilactobacillus raoultii]
MNEQSNESSAPQYYSRHQGLTTHFNDFYFVKILESDGDFFLIETKAKKDGHYPIDAQKFLIEKDLVYPVASSLDVVKNGNYEPDDPMAVIIPNRNTSPESLAHDQYRLAGLPHTLEYLNQFHHTLKRHADLESNRPAHLPFWAINCDQPALFSEIKVAWDMVDGQLKTAHLETHSIYLKNNLVIPTDNLQFVVIPDLATEMYFLGRMREIAQAHQEQSVWPSQPAELSSAQIPIEKYDDANPYHYLLELQMKDEFGFI